MLADAIPCKTALARQSLLQRDALPRAHRLFLILIDGQKSLRQLSVASRQLGIDHATLEALTHAGLIG